MKRLLPVVVVLVSLLAAPTHAQERDTIFEAFERGDYAAALIMLRPFAEQGITEAQVLLGSMYKNGEGVPQDYAEAVKWYRLGC